jgi:hypothetical protein
MRRLPARLRCEPVAEPVDIILLGYNRLDYLVEMVESLEQRTRWPYRLTVVDNASAPPTRQWLRDNAARFHQVIWNPRNEHLAGFQHGIEATTSELFVLSDADLVVEPPTSDGCWLERLVSLATRHPDFGLLGVRLDSVSEARNAELEGAPLIDGEILESSTGVWLNLIRRSALRVPYMSDGITCHALRRAGHRVGIAAEIRATHLGDGDPQRHPDYLARKQAASGWSTTYPDYPELRESERPPTLLEIAFAAPLLAALERNAISPIETVELFAPDAPLAAVAPTITAHDGADLAPAAARAIALVMAGGDDHAQRQLADAFALAGEWVALLGPPAVPLAPADWTLTEEQPGPHPALLRFAALAGRPRWQRLLLYSTTEHRDHWLAVFRAACFGEDLPLRVYVFHRDPPLPPLPPPAQPPSRPAGNDARPKRRAPRIRRRRLGALATKARRLIVAEWHLARGRGGER